MTDLNEIRKEADRFFEWPDGSDKLSVTLTSACLFARHISEKAGLSNQEKVIGD